MGIARTLLNVVGDVVVTLIVAINEKEFDRSIFEKDPINKYIIEDNLVPK
jgi:Na+/H+-dicarboxylate symporter